jgi:hypothetical protein
LLQTIFYLAVLAVHSDARSGPAIAHGEVLELASLDPVLRRRDYHYGEGAVVFLQAASACVQAYADRIRRKASQRGLIMPDQSPLLFTAYSRYN